MSPPPASTLPGAVDLGVALARFEPVGLAELDDAAALQTRVDRKYLLDAATAIAVVGGLADDGTASGLVRALEIDGRRTGTYRSTYFDTAELASYRLAAHRRPRRFKVRTRTYLASGSTWLEVKVRDRRGRSVKERIPHAGHADELTAEARAFLGTFEEVAGHVDELAPVLETTYRRATLLCGHRATIDVGLRCAVAGHDDALPLGPLEGLVIVETKSEGVRPGPIDRVLWGRGIRPTKLSKFGVGMAVAHALPANRWRRALAGHRRRPVPSPSRPSAVGAEGHVRPTTSGGAR